jgi:asparagine synthase (glutamine-hydrolysing)
MCGIFGLFRIGGLDRKDRWILRGMADHLAKRGPDGEAFHLERDVAIGMKRLAIIDLNGGWQPFYSEDRSIVVVANGEIYNFVELRSELEGRGHSFSTGSDCECILHAYEEAGEDCVHMLRGMFAFAIIDRRSKSLLLARDRMGEKPLCYAASGGRFAFCSELAALVGSGAVPCELNPEAMRDYFYWNFIPEPSTAISGVMKLDAGSTLRLDLASGKICTHRYWRLSDAPPLDGDPVDTIRRELEQVGKIITRSDVPVGVGLSGGIDSSAIAALVKRHSRQPVTLFTIGYEGMTWQDERAWARDFALHLGLPHVELRLSTSDVVASFPQMCISRDDPLTDWSGSGFMALYGLAHQHGVRVMFAGQGGDELFFGYPWLRLALRSSRRKAALLGGTGSVLDYLSISGPPPSLAGVADWLESVGGLRRGLKERLRDRRSSRDQVVFWDVRREFTDSESLLPILAGPMIRDLATSPSRKFDSAALWGDLEASLTELVCDTFLQSNGFVLCDRLSMSCSVEGRLPLVDYRFAETVVGLRKARSDLQLGHKAWLRAAMSAMVPEQVLSRPKRGFTPPWRTWTRALMKSYGPLLARGALVEAGVLRPEAAEMLARRSFDRLGRPYPLSFPALVLELWVRGIQSAAAATPAGPQLSGEPLLRSGRSMDRTEGTR